MSDSGMELNMEPIERRNLQSVLKLGNVIRIERVRRGRLILKHWTDNDLTGETEK